MRQKSNHRDYVFYLILLLALLGFFWFFTNQHSTASVPYSQMVELFQSEQVSSFTVQNNVVTMELKSEVDGKKEASCAISDFTAFYEDLNPLVQAQKKSGVLTSYDYKKDTQSVNWVTLLPLPALCGHGLPAAHDDGAAEQRQRRRWRPVPVRQGQIHLRRTDEEEGQLP